MTTDSGVVLTIEEVGVGEGVEVSGVPTVEPGVSSFGSAVPLGVLFV